MRHIRAVHRLERPYGCTLCDAKFSDRSNLARHMRLIHGIAGKVTKASKTKAGGGGK